MLPIRRGSAWWALGACGGLCVDVAAAAAAPQAQPAAASAVSAPLRDLAAAGTTPADAARAALAPLPWLETRPAVALPGSAAPLAMPGLLTSFEGLANADNAQALYPPSANGDIGPSHYVQVVNLALTAFNRSGTRLVPAVKTANLFIPLGLAHPCSTSGIGDATVRYDHLADRWLLVQAAGPYSGPFYECVAVSRSPDPTGAWNVFAFAAPSGKFPDAVHLGLAREAYYLSAMQFALPGYTLAGAAVFALDRAKLLAGDAGAGMITFDLGVTDPNIFGLLPGDLDGPAPPAGTREPFAMVTSDESGDARGDALRLFEFVPDFATPANSTFTELPYLPVAAFDAVSPSGRQDIPQPGTAIKLDSVSDRLNSRLQYRYHPDGHQSLAVVHTVDVSGDPSAAVYRAGLRYYELRRTLPGAWTVFDQGTFTSAADPIHRWMGSAALDHAGDLAVGYSVSDAVAVYPGLAYAGRLASDPPGSLAQGEAALVIGGSAQTGLAYRWGSFTSLTMDPLDDCTFWYTGEYYATTPTPCSASAYCWQTRIASFRFPSCSSSPVDRIFANGFE